ncbi:DNA sulfur modification protein DndB [Methylobacillus gramineus]|uniref:DNA sulfur modification protein DndB n=1 Tax=Methylobacillus gramineus TaxID=755169 RepID=UPI001D0000A0|nr:DNA sulfur modification protein DndB [Methylobacillus gramineus]MCB5186148.1 DNA sulfur modification protein DndB [Methylobacillus gramineus]
MAESGYSHTFPAIRGVQAGQVFYVAMCPLKIVPKIFIFNEHEVPPELRAQRSLNKARIPEIASYLLENPDNYILSALTSSIDATDVDFQPYEKTGHQGNMGVLSIPMDARILINDGQHRRAAIEQALKENPVIGHDNVPVLFFIDAGLIRSQQMFADLNKYAVRPGQSLGTLYDHRDPTSELARHIAMHCTAFQGLVEMEKSNISNRSVKLFTLSGIKHASRALLKKTNSAKVSEEERELALEFWETVAAQLPDWKRAKERTVAASELRENYIHAYGIALHALAIAGAELIKAHPEDWKSRIQKISQIDWSRSNSQLWEGRAMNHGRISKARVNVLLTSNLIKQHLELPLKPEEWELESERKNERSN